MEVLGLDSLAGSCPPPDGDAAVFAAVRTGQSVTKTGAADTMVKSCCAVQTGGGTTTITSGVAGSFRHSAVM